MTDPILGFGLCLPGYSGNMTEVTKTQQFLWKHAYDHYIPGDTDAPASTHVERGASCARVRYSPTLQQQNSISSKGLDADFIIQYDVDLRDLMGEIQVRRTRLWLVKHTWVCHNTKTCFWYFYFVFSGVWWLLCALLCTQRTSSGS